MFFFDYVTFGSTTKRRGIFFGLMAIEKLRHSAVKMKLLNCRKD